jgi:hypothetical protein
MRLAFWGRGTEGLFSIASSLDCEAAAFELEGIILEGKVIATCETGASYSRVSNPRVSREGIFAAIVTGTKFLRSGVG